MAKKHLIIGCGPAGLAALEKIRSLSDKDEIKLVSMENHLPYSVASLPYLLAGRVKEGDIWVRGEEYLQAMKVTYARGREVVRLSPDKKQVVYQDGTVDEYDTLLIASGSEPVKTFKGLEEAGSLSFHTLADYHELVGMLKDKTEVAILGAGMIAMELSRALLERGVKVIIIGRGRPLRVYFDEQPGAYIREIFIDRGAQIFIGKQIAEVKRNGGKFEVACADGDVFRADLLINCVGVKPRTSFLEGSGLKINRGVLVDNKMRTNIGGIYAAGAVAEAPDLFSNQPGVGAIVPSSADQGKVAGANMAGEEISYKGWISMNILPFWGNICSSLGLAIPRGAEQVMEEKDDQRKYFKRLVFQDDRLVGAMFLNTEVDPGVIRYLIENRVSVAGHKDLLFNKTKETARWLMIQAEKK